MTDDIEKIVLDIYGNDMNYISFLDFADKYTFLDESLNVTDTEEETYSEIRITKDLDACSIKFENLKLNLKELFDDLFNSGLKTIPLIAAGTYFLGSLTSAQISVIIFFIVLYSKSKVVNLQKIDLSKDQVLLLYALWINRDEKRNWVDIKEAFQVYKSFLQKHKFTPQKEGDFNYNLNKLVKLGCITINEHVIYLKEEVSIEVSL